MQGTQVWQLNPGAATAEDTPRARAPHGENPPQREAHSRSQRQPLLTATKGSPRRDPARLSINTDAPSHVGALTQPVWGTRMAARGSLLPAPQGLQDPWGPLLWTWHQGLLPGGPRPPALGGGACRSRRPTIYTSARGTRVKTRGRGAVRGLGRGQTLGEADRPLTARL